MKLKICLLAFLTLLNYTVNAAGDHDNLGKRPFPEENDHPSKKIRLQEQNINNQNNILENNQINHDLYFFDHEIEYNTDDYTSEDEDEDEDANTNKDSFIHPCAENLYDETTLWKKEFSILQDIEDINQSFKRQEIDELQRRKKIIEAVSRKFNADFLLQHFKYNQNEDHTTFDRENFRHGYNDPNEDPSYSYEDNILEYISRYEFFSINKIGESNIILHVKDFNRYLQYFPWIKGIWVYFSDDFRHIQRMAKATTSLNAFDNISTLKYIESITIVNSGINPENEEEYEYPKWIKELNLLEDIYIHQVD